MMSKAMVPLDNRAVPFWAEIRVTNKAGLARGKYVAASFIYPGFLKS
jgi:hypothetical protein